MPEAAVARDDAVRDQPGGVRPALLRRQPAPHRRPLHPQGVDARPSHLQVRTLFGQKNIQEVEVLWMIKKGCVIPRTALYMDWLLHVM